MERAELTAWLRLTLTPGVGNDTARKLLAAFGSAEAVFEQSEAALRQLGGSKLVSAVQVEPPKLAGLLQATVDWLAGGDNLVNLRAVAPIGSALYPAALLNIEDPPLVLYMLGSQLKRVQAAPDNIAFNLAIVGSRNPTPQGETNARQFAKAFAEQGLCIVSGLALGVDGAAHDGALLGGGTTIAVVGTGLDRVYPKKHLALAHRIAANGLIISEFPIGTPPLNANFPKRNRIISGLSTGTLVVEAALKSGSLITARLASEQGKDVFAIPGSIHSPQSRGCHYLIKQGAKLVETAQDVMEELRIPLASVAPLLDDDVEPAEGDSSFLSALGFDIVSLDALQARTGLPTPELQAKLLGLELDGFVTRLPGGLFQRQAAG
ncbi:MAG: DNA-processing protein DprA [Polaromonas sp.]